MLKQSGPISSPRQRSSIFFVWWVSVNTVVWAIGPAVFKVLARQFLAWSPTVATDGPRLYLATTLSFLALGSLLQWLVLRQRLRLVGWWPLATFVGGYLGYWVITESLNPNYPQGGHSLPIVTTYFGFVGAAIGALQWLVLRKRVAGARWWPLFSAAGGVAFLLASKAVASTAFVETVNAESWWKAVAIVTAAMQGAAGGAAYAIVTGLALLWLLRDWRRESAGAFSAGPSGAFPLVPGPVER